MAIRIAPLYYGINLVRWLVDQSRHNTVAHYPIAVEVTRGQLKSIRTMHDIDVTIPSWIMEGGRVAYGCDMMPLSDRIRCHS